MSFEENKAIHHRVYEEIWGGGNLAVIDDVISDNWYYNDRIGPEFKGKEGYKRMVQGFRNAFPNVKFDIEDTIAEGDKVVIRATCSGTHSGELPGGIAPTGKRFSVNEVAIVRIEDSKIKEEWGSLDMLELYRQLGISPPSQ